MDREILAAMTEYVVLSQKVIARLLEEKGDVVGHDFHGNRWTGGLGGSGNLPFNAHGDQYFHALSPKGQASVIAACKKYGVNVDAITKEVEGRLRNPDGTPNKDLLEQGAKWYPMAHELTEKVAESTQAMPHPITPEQEAAALALISPKLAWEANAEVGSRVAQWVASGKGDGMTNEEATNAFKAEWQAQGWGGKTLGSGGTENARLAVINGNIEQAIGVLSGRTPIEEALTSPKQRSFANDIMLPGQTRDVTVDVQMQKSITFACDPPPMPKDNDSAEKFHLPNERTMAKFFKAGGEKEVAAGAGYVTVAAATRVAAEHLGYSPDTVQAAYWLAVQDQTPPNWIRSTGSTMPAMDMTLAKQLLGHPFIGTAGYKGASVANWPLSVDYGTMALTDIETMTDDEYEAELAKEDSEVEVEKSAGLKYSDDEPRDDHGRWTNGGGGDGGDEAPTRVSTIDQAIALLGDGKGIMFERPDQAVTLLHKLAQMANEAKAAGRQAKAYDLCKVSVADTNLFCSENVGIPREAMPQLVGKPTPGSPADALEKNAKGEVDLGQMFRDSLTAQGNLILDTNEFASHLRASQTEMDGTKVGGMMEAMEQGKIPPAAIFVSDDNYIVDGHHRWAATVGLGLGDKREMSMPVARVDMKILPLLAAANKFADAMGIPQAGLGKGAWYLDSTGVPRSTVKGDAVGHEFHGNRYTGGLGGKPPANEVEWGDRLTPTEQKAVTDYVGYGYVLDNTIARHGPEAMLKSGWDAAAVGRQKDLVEELDRAIAKAPLAPSVLFRGMGADPWTGTDGGNENFDWSKTIGTSFVDNGFVSTSLAPETAENWAGLRGGGVVAELHIAEGLRAAPASYFAPTEVTAAENEHLLPRSLTYTVRSYTPPELAPPPRHPLFDQPRGRLVIDVTK